MVVLLFTKKVQEKDGDYSESEWILSMVNNPPTKELYCEMLKTWMNDYLKKNFPQTGFKNFVILKAGVIKRVIPCKKECPKINVSKLIANFYSTHPNLPVPNVASLKYVFFDKVDDGVQASITKYLLKASPDFEVYWDRKFYKVKKQVKKVKIVLKKLDIGETIENKELMNLIYYNLFDLNRSSYDDAVEFIKMTNPDGVVFFEFSVYNSVTDYEIPTNNLSVSVTEKKFILDVPNLLFNYVHPQ